MEERFGRQDQSAFDAAPAGGTAAEWQAQSGAADGHGSAAASAEDGRQDDRPEVPPVLPRRRFFGLVECVSGTAGEPGCYNYVGPRNRLLLRLSIVFGGRRGADGDYEAVYLDGKKCLFDWHRGLLGPGVDLIKPPKKPANMP